MSLFKVLRGSEANLPTQKTDGWAYFCTDTGSFWIDHKDSDDTLVRSKISANFADKLRYVKDGETVELYPSEIATIDGTVKKAKQLNVSDLGNYTNKTVGELQTRINSWLEENFNVGAMFMAKGNWPTVWNNGSSAVISDGRTYTATVVSAYQNANYLQLMISTYGEKEIFFVVKEAGTWKNIIKNAFKDDIDSLQASVDGKAALSHNHDASDITSGTLSSDRLPTVPIAKGGTGATTAAGALTNLGLTATATELNYMDGVTSSVQTQLNKKANSSHTHSYLPLSGGTIDGRLSVHGYGNNGGLNLDGYQGRLELRAEIGTASIACVDGTNSAALIFSPNKPANEGVKLSMKKDGTLSLYKLYGEHNKPTANDIGAASTMSLTTAEYNTMSANNELQETTLYMLTDDTEEEDLQATVNEMNNIDYEANLAFDVNEIV